MKVLKILLTVAALMMAVVVVQGTALADTSYTVLQSRYNFTSASVSFTSGVLSDTANELQNAGITNASGAIASLQANVTKLTTDLQTLHGFVASGDSKGYDNFVKSTLTPDLKSAQNTLKDARSHFKQWGVKSTTIEKLKDDYAKRKATYDSSINDAIVYEGHYQLQYYNQVLDKANSQVLQLSSIGVNVGNMQDVLNGAQTFIAPLDSAVQANDPVAIKNYLSSHSLFDGSPTCYHLDAKFKYQRILAVTNYFEPMANKANHGDQITQIKNDLNSVHDKVYATGPYSKSDRETIVQQLNGTSNELRKVINEIFEVVE